MALSLLSFHTSNSLLPFTNSLPMMLIILSHDFYHIVARRSPAKARRVDSAVSRETEVVFNVMQTLRLAMAIKLDAGKSYLSLPP